MNIKEITSDFLFCSYQWFCHFDDDVYVNIPRLHQLLKQYDSHRPYYIGKWHEKNHKVHNLPVRKRLVIVLLSVLNVLHILQLNLIKNTDVRMKKGNYVCYLYI